MLGIFKSTKTLNQSKLPYGVRDIKITPYAELLNDGVWQHIPGQPVKLRAGMVSISFAGQEEFYSMDGFDKVARHQFEPDVLLGTDFRAEYKSHDLHGRQIETRHIVGKFLQDKRTQPIGLGNA